MRYLVLGAGALGGYFGGMLLKGAGRRHLLVRPKRTAPLQRDGLVVKSQDGELRVQAKRPLPAKAKRPETDALIHQM
jgi:2-dehydropantoate 2-reductase